MIPDASEERCAWFDTVMVRIKVARGDAPAGQTRQRGVFTPEFDGE
jgi:hypothetical protein